MRKILIAASLFLFADCRRNTPPTAIQTPKPTAPVSNSAAPGNAVSPDAAPLAIPSNSSDKSKIKTADSTGVVTKINLELGSVELDHDEIKGIMPAMQMEFYVSDKKMLEGLQVGDKVNFVLEDDAGAERIVGIRKSR